MPHRTERGRSRLRFEDARFLTGKGRYVDDLEAPDALHGEVLRSSFGHALIRSIDISAASAMPGVAGVFTAQDLRQDGLGHLSCAVKVATLAPLIIPPRPALAEGRVRHVGDPVAFVVARSKDEARDAAERIVVEYEELPAVTEARAAIAPGAPLLWKEAQGNIAFRFQKGDQAAVAAAFASAARIVELDLVNNRVVAAPLEPRAAIGSYDAREESLRLVLTGQGVHGIRDQLARDVFHMPPERIHLVAPDVGGGFGAKNFLYPEWVLVLFAARRLGREVKWVSGRNEDFLSSAQGRDNVTRARLALDAEGRFLALDVSTLANMGAYISSAGPGPSTNSSSTAQGGVYDIPAVFMDVRGVFTNTVPIDAYRGAGKPEANYVIERLIDLAAREIGRDAGGASPPQHHQARSLSLGARHADRGRGVRRKSREGAGARRSRGLRGAARRGQAARQAARPWGCLLSRDLARPAGRIRRRALRGRRPGGARSRHAIERPRP